MNQTKPKTLEQILKQFDEEINPKLNVGNEYSECACINSSDIEDFLRTSITTLLESLLEEEDIPGAINRLLNR